jgi:cystathionine beta-lyase family protein involved in aluminum resistance
MAFVGQLFKTHDAAKATLNQAIGLEQGLFIAVKMTIESLEKALIIVIIF